MKKIYFLFTALLISSLGFSQELFVNGDLETWNDPSTPAGFTHIENVEQEATEVHGGNFSAKVVATATRDLGQTITGVVPGNLYTISFWYKVELGDGTDARIWSFWRNGTTNLPDNIVELRHDNSTYLPNNDGAWSQFSITLPAPATADGFYFEVRTYNNATVYYDDFSFFAEASSGEPALVITSPTEGSTVTTADTQVSFIVSNFDVANGTGDGHIHYTLDGGSVVMKYDTDPILLEGLSNGSHTLYVELVDNAHQPIVPAVNATLNFTTDIFVLPTLPHTESFNYSVGSNLNDQSSWSALNTGDQIVTTSGNLSYNGLVDSVGNSVSFDGVGQESTLEFTSVEAGEVYASFIFRVTDQSNVTDAGGAYFASLSNTTASYDARLWVKPVSVETPSTEFLIGISNTSTAADISFDANSYAVGSDIFIVMSYNVTDGVVKAWINPAEATFGLASAPAITVTATDASPAAFINKFILRQDNAARTPFITLDELRIGTTWADVTPTTLSNNDFTITNFNIYPNPTSTGFVNITSTNADAMSVSVFDMLGKQVINKTISNNRLDVSSLNAGMYIVKISQNNATVTKKLVIK